MLRIVAADLFFALGDNDPEHLSYLDRETGAVILVPGDLFSPEDEEFVDEEALASDPRYVAVEPISSSEAYRWMEQFASLVEAPDVRELLRRALERPRPFRGFRNVLHDHPVERQLWFDFEEARLREAAAEWLQLNGIVAELTPA